MNPNNIKTGDKIFIEQAWEDETGNYHDEYAEVNAIDEKGEMDLHFFDASDTTNEFLRKAEFFAKDYKPEK